MVGHYKTDMFERYLSVMVPFVKPKIALKKVFFRLSQTDLHDVLEAGPIVFCALTRIAWKRKVDITEI